jgi:hypothetical protein
MAHYEHENNVSKFWCFVYMYMYSASQTTECWEITPLHDENPTEIRNCNVLISSRLFHRWKCQMRNIYDVAVDFMDVYV